MKRELGIARCGLACCMCSENEHCSGCNSGDCPDKDWCENRRCSLLKEIGHCYECQEDCHKGLLSKIKPYGFTLYAKRYGEEELLNCLERNEQNGVVYHREGIVGDYDDFDDVEKLIVFIRTGKSFMTHKMNLYPEPFEMIRNGQKSIELRLNDEKRQRIKVGDMIEFTQTETGEKLITEVIALHRFDSFAELYRGLPLLKCGYTKADIADAKPEDMDLYYTPEQQERDGVLGIELKPLNQ